MSWQTANRLQKDATNQGNQLPSMMAANREGGPVRARHFFLWIAIAAVASVAAQRWGAFDPPAQRPPAEAGTPITGRAKIIDGDLLEVAGERIRLFGIDAPEGRQQCRDANGLGLRLRARRGAHPHGADRRAPGVVHLGMTSSDRVRAATSRPAPANGA